jgi:phage terminase small subunit
MRRGKGPGNRGVRQGWEAHNFKENRLALSNKQQAFINEYLVDRNATRAAIRAGYSEKGARVQGHRLLTDANVSAEIKARVDEKAMTANEVLERLADMARGDISDLMALTPSGFTFELMVKDKDGNLIPNPKTKLIKKIKQKVTTILGKKEDDEDREIIETEIELYDAQAALVQLGKHHKLFTDQVQISGEVGIIWDLPTSEPQS